MAFGTEAELVETAVDSPELRHLVASTMWPLLLTEPKGLFGVPDAVFATMDFHGGHWVCGSTAAFEMKLRDWKRALKQAFRYRSFANSAFVVLDAAHARPAVKRLDRFRRSNIGLVTVAVSGEVTVHFAPTPEPPVCERMTARLFNAVTSHIEAC